MPELPQVKKKRLQEQYLLEGAEIDYLLSNLKLIDYFEETVKFYSEPKIVFNYLSGDIQSYLNQNQIAIDQIALSPEKLANILKLLEKNIISSRQIKILLQYLLKNDEDIDAVITKLGLKQINSETEIYDLIFPFISENIKLIDQYDERPERVLKFYIGHLMKITKGQANPQVSQKVVLKIINAVLKSKKNE